MYAKELTFNTGRGYSADGQEITAVFVPERITDNGDQEGAIEFVDVTRGIDGRFENVCFSNREILDGTFQARVIDLYDRGGYDSPQVIKLDCDGYLEYKVGRYEKREVIEVVLIDTATGETVKGNFTGPDGYALIVKAFQELTGNPQYAADQTYKVLSHTPAKKDVKQMTKRETIETMSDVANRAIDFLATQGITQDKLSVMMDLEYVNKVCPIDFDRLLAFDDGNFGHDIAGIYRHWDRQTKQLTDCFCPRSAK